ncbi:hypothetical protein M5689_019159 [Euphorbia peplus]|nr:hypothetical protein M5689_019159 [Euphorbia peplus]
MANVVPIIVVMLMSYTIVVEVEVVEAARLLLTFPRPFPNISPLPHLLPHLQLPQLQFPKRPHMPKLLMPQLPQIPNLHSPMSQLPQISNMHFPMPQLPQNPNLHFPMPKLPKTPTFTNDVKPLHLTTIAPSP